MWMYNDAIWFRMLQTLQITMMHLCCKGSKLHVDFFLESYTRRTTHNGILKNCTVANIAIKGCTFFEESYTRRTTHQWNFKNCTVANIAIKAFLRV